MTALLLMLALAGAPDAGVEPPETLEELRRLAKQLEPEVRSPWVKRWLANVNSLKPVSRATWFCSKDTDVCAEKNPGDFIERRIDDDFAYARITDPLGYARAFEVLAEAGFQPSGRKLLDFGYGNFGQLLMLSELGVDVHGVEVDPLLPIAVKRLTPRKGKLTLHHGYFASDRKLVKDIGSGYDVWLSKNTLKRGYVHPAEPMDPKAQIDLGLDDAKVLRLIHAQLNKGGFFLIYNIGGSPSPSKPMTDIRCPFAKEALIATGFEVFAYERDDTEKCKAMATSLEWDKEWPALNSELRASYTLARRR
jgi:hypothetical protein